MRTISLRHLSALITTGDMDSSSGSGPTDEYLAKDTECDLEEALCGFYRWWDSTMESLPFEENTEAYDAIWGLVNAHAQYAHEAGVKTGFKLAMDIMTEQTDELELQQRAHALVDGKKAAT